MVSDEVFAVDRNDGIVTLTLNRPHRKNAIPADAWDALSDLFVAVSRNPDDRVLVITGAGDAFCSGADLGAPRSSSDPDQVTASRAKTSGVGSVGNSIRAMRSVSDAALRLHELTKPTIAAVNGVAAGAGCNLALGCDMVIASDQARFSEIFAKRGLVPDFGGAWLLPRLIGMHRAKELVFLAEVISAHDADRIGLVNRVVAHATLMDEVYSIAARLAAMPPVQLSVAKRMLHQSLSVTLAEALEFENVAQTAMFSSSDTAEAMIAFVEKREPRVTGH